MANIIGLDNKKIRTDYVYDTNQGKTQEEINKALAVSDTDLIRFGIDADGNYGYKKVGADTIYPFNPPVKEIFGVTGFSTSASKMKWGCSIANPTSYSFGWTTAAITSTITCSCSVNTLSMDVYFLWQPYQGTITSVSATNCNLQIIKNFEHVFSNYLYTQDNLGLSKAIVKLTNISGNFTFNVSTSYSAIGGIMFIVHDYA